MSIALSRRTETSYAFNTSMTAFHIQKEDMDQNIFVSHTTEYEVSSSNTLGVSMIFKSVSGPSHSGISSNGRVEVLGIGERLKLDRVVLCE